MGVAIEKSFDEENNLILEVCFEEDDNKRIVFKQDGPGADRKFVSVNYSPHKSPIKKVYKQKQI
jgi:hypothetical protein